MICSVGLKLLFTKKNQHKKSPEYIFQEWFDMYWKRLVAFCEHHCNDEEIAMDMVQDIFCSLWKRKDAMEEIAQIEHYLFRAARIRINDYYRERYKRLHQNNELVGTFCDSINNTEETIYFRDLDHFVDGLVNRLPCRCRQVYTLSRNSGLSIPEIAVALSLSEKTVEAHLTKALKFLRNKISTTSQK
jgi:RNA polymerase sigma-70 factor (family 1)